MRSKLLIGVIFLFVFSFFDLTGQSFIYHTDTSLGGPVTALWGKLDVATCSDSVMYSFNGYGFKDVTILPNNSIFTYFESPYFPEKGVGQIFTSIWSISSDQNVASFRDHKFVEALGCDGNGLIYGAGKGLSAYDSRLIQHTNTYLGDFPPEMQAAGDLTFREGRLYMSTLANTLVEVDVVNPMNSQVFMTFPEGTPPIHAMTTLHNACGETITYAIGTHDTGSIIYELDFATKTLTEKCRTTFRIMGAASAEECVNTVCKVFIDLDKNNSSGSTRNDFRPKSVCNAPVYIADQDVEIYAEEAIDSVIITLNGVLDTGLENLTAATAANLSITGSGTTKIKLVNTGTATTQDFQTALSAIFYKNDSTVPTNGNREVWVRGYTRSYVSEVATAKIQIQNNLALEQDSISLKCYGDAGIKFTANATGGVAPYRYQWENGDTTASKANLMAGNYSIIITDQGGCQLMDTIQVIQPPKSDLELIPNGSLCVGGSLKIDASSGFATYQWSNGDQTASITVDEPGQYALTVTSAAGCSDTASIEILESNIEAVISKTDPSCFGNKDGRIVIDSVISGNPPYFYRLNNDAAQTSSHFQQLAAGTYQVDVEDNNGCFVQTTVTLTEPEPLTLTLGDDTALSLGDSLVLFARTNANNPLIQWSPATGLSCATCLTTIAKPLESTRYEAILTNQAGCTTKDDIVISVNRQASIFIPNAFSPNGDGVNDVFTVFADASVQRIALLRVFDRWGNLLYEVKDLVPGIGTKGWDGSFRGKALPEGMYIYMLELERLDGVMEKRKGEVLLAR